MKTFRLRIVTPEKTVFDGEVVSISMRSKVGAFGVMANHAPMIVECPAGPLKALDGRSREMVFGCDQSIFEMDDEGATVLTSFALATQVPKDECAGG